MGAEPGVPLLAFEGDDLGEFPVGGGLVATQADKERACLLGVSPTDQ